MNKVCETPSRSLLVSPTPESPKNESLYEEGTRDVELE
jgi:hypothetical protein